MAGTHPRDLVDNLAAAVAAIAAAEPHAFLEVFDDDRFLEDGYVLLGLGKIDDPRATERLIRVAGSGDKWRRMDVAIGLGRRASPASTDTLGRLLDDDDYLVRYHALASLAKIGDTSVVPTLRRFQAKSTHEAGLVEETISAILGRAAEGPATR
jgi:HEAT repeat protein